MGDVMRLMLGLAVVLAAVAGCGSGKSPSEDNGDPLAGYPKGPTREFIVPGGDNSVPLAGHEGTRAEREQASAVVARWMQARAAKDFVEECRLFSRGYLRSLVVEDAEQVSEGKVKTCPQALAYFGSSASGDFRNTLSGPIDSLRVTGSRAYAQYHGTDGIDYQLPLEKQGGRWLVAMAAPINQEG
jgi:hypothetical protein